MESEKLVNIVLGKLKKGKEKSGNIDYNYNADNKAPGSEPKAPKLTPQIKINKKKINEIIDRDKNRIKDLNDEAREENIVDLIELLQQKAQKSLRELQNVWAACGLNNIGVKIDENAYNEYINDLIRFKLKKSRQEQIKEVLEGKVMKELGDEMKKGSLEGYFEDIEKQRNNPNNGEHYDADTN
jgi:polyribonucleotide nucleotidyltransferase